jgi:hypothetical protein
MTNHSADQVAAALPRKLREFLAELDGSMPRSCADIIWLDSPQEGGDLTAADLSKLTTAGVLDPDVTPGGEKHDEWVTDFGLQVIDAITRMNGGTPSPRRFKTFEEIREQVVAEWRALPNPPEWVMEL